MLSAPMVLTLVEPYNSILRPVANEEFGNILHLPYSGIH